MARFNVRFGSRIAIPEISGAGELATRHVWPCDILKTLGS